MQLGTLQGVDVKGDIAAVIMLLIEAEDARKDARNTRALRAIIRNKWPTTSKA